MEKKDSGSPSSREKRGDRGRRKQNRKKDEGLREKKKRDMVFWGGAKKWFWGGQNDCINGKKKTKTTEPSKKATKQRWGAINFGRNLQRPKKKDRMTNRHKDWTFEKTARTNKTNILTEGKKERRERILGCPKSALEQVEDGVQKGGGRNYKTVDKRGGP